MTYDNILYVGDFVIARHTIMLKAVPCNGFYDQLDSVPCDSDCFYTYLYTYTVRLYDMSSLLSPMLMPLYSLSIYAFLIQIHHYAYATVLLIVLFCIFTVLFSYFLSISFCAYFLVFVREYITY